MLLHSSLPALGLLGLAHAASSASKEACQAIADAIPERVHLPLSIEYEAEINKYWSTALRQLRPACVVSPTTTEGVAQAVRILGKHPDVSFAAKSGGHDPNAGHASIQDGVLIALREISGTEYDGDKGVAYVKPGGEWNDVIGALDPYGVTVLGGRLGIVGIGGYLNQGGISFLSAQYGLAADGIREWEVVFPNGTIGQVNAKERPDLAVAMRGGGGQFGIVTKFTMETHPIGKVWGGSRIYDASQADKIYGALHGFVPNQPDGGKSAIIVSKVDAVGGLSTFLVFLFYDGPEPPATGAFANFLTIPHLVDATSTRSYADMLKTNGAAGSLAQGRVSFRTYTVPYVASRPEIYAEIADQWKSITAPLLDRLTAVTSQCSVDFQPLPAAVGAQSERRGGNAMGISGADGDRLLLELQCLWPAEADDDQVHAMSRQMTSWLDSRVPAWLEGAPEDSSYLPFFMNDAMGDQNVTGRYRDYGRFKALREEIDPEGVFLRAGGFKF